MYILYYKILSRGRICFELFTKWFQEQLSSFSQTMGNFNAGRLQMSSAYFGTKGEGRIY